MESNGIENCIHCTAAVATEAMKYPNEFIVIPRGSLEVKGKGLMNTFVLAAKGRKKVTIEKLELHRAHKRRESYLMHRKLTREFNLETRDDMNWKLKDKFSLIIFIVTFIVGVVAGHYYPRLFFKVPN